MSERRKLTIRLGDEHKIYESYGKIEQDDFFVDSYAEAAKLVKTIVSTQSNDENVKAEFLNNIIAFCGERGQGKSSAMHNFTNELQAVDKKETILQGLKEIENTKFVSAKVIDPSLFDDNHNILDVLLSNIFQDFKEKADDNRIEETERRDLVRQFQKVYREISFIYGGEKAKAREYDIDGNIENLAYLGESTNLKKDLQKLISLYCKYIHKAEAAYYIIPIDDLDMNIKNAYKMAEQIRKYLILPNVILIMAIRMEQLELCIRQENICLLDHLLKNEKEKDKIFAEIENMSLRYLEKLIPVDRRILLPKVEAVDNNGNDVLALSLRDRNDKTVLPECEGNSLQMTLLKLLYLKTGICLVPRNGLENYLVPWNLREFVQLVSILNRMEEVDLASADSKELGKREKNIKIFRAYVVQSWLGANIRSRETRESLSDIFNQPDEYVNQYVYDICEKNLGIEVYHYLWNTGDLSLGEIFSMLMKWKERKYEQELLKSIYAFKLIYTIILNEKMVKYQMQQHQPEQKSYIQTLVGKSLWGSDYAMFYPKEGGTYERDAIVISTQNLIEIILTELKKNVPQISGEAPKPIKIMKSEIEGLSKEERSFYVKSLCIVAILRKDEEKPLYSTNNTLKQEVTISLESALIHMLDYRSVYEKSGYEDLGITLLEFLEEAKTLEGNTQGLNLLINNPDILQRVAEYCIAKRDPKDVVDNRYVYALKNINECMEENDYLKNIIGSKKEDAGKFIVVDEILTTVLYKALGEQKDIQTAQGFMPEEDIVERAIAQAKKQELAYWKSMTKEEFLHYLDSRMQNEAPQYVAHVVKQMRPATKEKLLDNLHKIMDNLVIYLIFNESLPEYYSAEGLYGLYYAVLSHNDKQVDTVKQLIEWYKKVYDEYNTLFDEHELQQQYKEARENLLNPNKSN